MIEVIPKNLWIEQVIHALTVTKEWVIHALTVTNSRINGHHTIYSLYLPIFKTPVVGASLFGDNLAGCHPNRLHLPSTALLKKFQTMKKIPVSLLILLCSLCFTERAIAQNKPLACQTDAVGGLEWGNGKWELSSYPSQKFILVQTNEGLTKASVGTALRIPNELVTCQKNETVTCFDDLGGHLLFDPKTLSGGIAILYGSISTKTKRDSVTVRVFSCTAF